MSEHGQRIVERAREFLGTPFLKHHRLKGTGIDCDNFAAEVLGAESLGEIIPRLEFVEFAAALPGDVLALCDELRREPDVPRHLVILSEVAPYPMGIHVSAQGVREHRLDASLLRRVHSVWRSKE